MKNVVVFVSVALIWVALAVGQQQTQINQQMRPTPPLSSSNKAKPLGKEDQLRAQQLLESAESAVGTLDSASRIVAYADLSRAYQSNDKKKAVELLESGLNASRDLQLESSNTQLNNQLKRELQQRIVGDFAKLEPMRLDQLMDQLPTDTRTLALRELMSYYGKNHELSRATDITMSIAQASEMPYDSASELMKMLGRNHPDETRSLFISSLASFQSHDHDSQWMGPVDFPAMIAEFSDQVPPRLALQAVDEVLSQAKKRDEKGDPTNVSLASPKGAVRFQSTYDYRLFQLMPVLRKYDPERADKLLMDRQDVSTLTTKYPDGIDSLRAGDDSTSNMSIMFGIGNKSNGQQPPQGPSPLERQRAAEIIADATKHPQDALANAAALTPELAVPVYIQIADIARNQEAAVSRAALGKAADFIEKIQLQNQMISNQRITSLYLELGDTEKAKDSLEKSLAVANRLYKRDSDADDPNTAPKAYWASTNGFRGVMAAAEKLDPAWATNLLKETPDDGIRVFDQIAMANALTGGPTGGMEIISAFKDGKLQMMRSMSGN